MTNAEKLTKEQWDELSTKGKILRDAVQGYHTAVSGAFGKSNRAAINMKKADQFFSNAKSALDDTLLNTPSAVKLFEDIGEDPCHAFYGELSDTQKSVYADLLEKHLQQLSEP